MKNDDQPAARELKEGQLWRVRRQYVFIVAVENLMVRFKLLDGLDKAGERTLTGGIDSLWRYLVSRKAQLV